MCRSDMYFSLFCIRYVELNIFILIRTPIRKKQRSTRGGFRLFCSPSQPSLLLFKDTAAFCRSGRVMLLFSLPIFVFINCPYRDVSYQRRLPFSAQSTVFIQFLSPLLSLSRSTSPWSLEVADWGNAYIRQH